MSPEPSGKPVSGWRRHAHEGLQLWRLGVAQLLQRWWYVLLIVGLGIGLILADARGWEDAVLQYIRQPDNFSLTRVARFLSTFGDAIWAILLAGALFVQGTVFGSPRWRQVAWVCLLALLASTLIVNLFRPTLGRARPLTGLPGKFHGPTLDAKFHGFPSGHATSAFAPAAAVAVAAPIVGVPCLVFAGGVSWSRMQLNRHRPLDVMTGAALGTFIGLCFGGAVEGARWRLRVRQRV